MSFFEIKKRCVERIMSEFGNQKRYLNRLVEELEELRKTESKNRGTCNRLWQASKEQNIKNADSYNSLIMFLLDIALIDPVLSCKDLYKDKFFGGTVPDIDTDFDPRVRDWVKAHIVDVFGEAKTCSIGTYQTYKTRAVIVDVSRALGLDVWAAMQVTKQMDTLAKFDVALGEGESEEQKIDEMDFEEVCKHYPELKTYFDKNPEVLTHAKVLRNQVKNAGKHAGGVIISNLDLQDKVAVFRDNSGAVVSVWSEGLATHELSEIGLVKFDILGLKNLSVISDCLQYIEAGRGRKLSRSRLPINDCEVIRLQAKQDCVGIFQFESPGTKPVIDAVGVDSIFDISAVTSLIRPGPKNMGMDQVYARRKHGEQYEMIPCLREILSETYGVIVYQEQVMKVAQVFAGFTPVESNQLRSVIAKKKLDRLPIMEEKFKKGAQARVDSGEVTEQEVDEIWNLLKSFGGYGFNRSVDKDTLVDTVDGRSKRICDFESGDSVWCYDGGNFVPTEVIALHDHGKLKSFEVTFDAGEKVTCSVNHKFLTPNGMLPLWKIMKDNIEVLSMVSSKTRRLDALGLWERTQKILVPSLLESLECSTKQVDSGRVVIRRVLSAVFVGYRHVYDLEVRHPSHNFALANGIITSNSHAMAYSAVTSAEFWLKHHYPTEYITALLNNTPPAKKKRQTDSRPLMMDYISYARRRGIKILGPNINKSLDGFSIEDGEMRFALNHIKQVGKSAADIVVEREANGLFKDVEDFHNRVNRRRVNKRVFMNLVYARAFDCFGAPQEVSDRYFELRKIKKDEPPEFTETSLEKHEREALNGLCLSKPTLQSQYRDKVESQSLGCFISDLCHRDSLSFVFGRVEDITPRVSKNGNPYLFIELSDDVDEIKFFVFQKGQKQFRGEIKKGYIAFIPLRKFEDSNTWFYDVNKGSTILQK